MVSRSRAYDPVELDGPATRRLVRALSAGVPMDALESRFGRSAPTLVRAARAAGWDGARGPEPLVAAETPSSVSLPPSYYWCSRRP